MSAHGDEPRHPGPGTLRWRERTLVSAGFDGELAARIARDGDVDLHALLELAGRDPASTRSGIGGVGVGARGRRAATGRRGRPPARVAGARRALRAGAETVRPHADSWRG